MQQVVHERKDDDQQTKIEISKSSWRNIIAERNSKPAKIESDGFNLFGEDQDFNLFEESKPEVKKPKISDEKYQKLKEKREQKKEKKEEKLKQKEKSKEARENQGKLDVPFEELPRKLQRKIEKQKKKREELKLARKLKIDMNQPDEKIFERYKAVFPEQADEKLREQIKYQKLVHKTIHRRK